MNDETSKLAMWDNVRVAVNSDTEHAGIAGLDGVVYGFTTPSLTNIEPVGQLLDDFAFNVFIESLGSAFWLDPSSIEYVSSPSEMTFTVGDNTIHVTRHGDGYREEIIRKKPWWQFW